MMEDLEKLDLDIQLLTNDELDQYDDLNENKTAGNLVDIDIFDAVLPDIPAVVFHVSLLVQGKIIPCMKSVILQSEYLSNMSEMFENCEALPVPEIVGSETSRTYQNVFRLLL